MGQHFRGALRAAIAILLLSVLLCSEALATSIPCYINTDTKVYNTPSTSAKLSLKVSEDLSVSMTGLSGSWAQVTREGVTAYIPVKYLTLKNRIKGYTTKSAALYKSASSSSKKLGTLPAGTAVYVNGRNGDYFRVQNEEGSITGYVKMSYLSQNKPNLSSSKKDQTSQGQTSSKVDLVIARAQKGYLKPYSTSPNPPYSFDCSNYIKYCFEAAGIELPASAEKLGYDDDYAKITMKNLKVGDLVCFNTDSSDDDASDHVGIYLGSGYFVHASSGAGKVVVSSLSSGYYNRVFSWGRRIL